MTVEERIVDELKAERDAIPAMDPGPTPEHSPRWLLYGTAAAVLALLVGIGYVWPNQTTNQPIQPFEPGVEVVTVSGDAEPDVVAAWREWWEAWVQVRATMTERQFNPEPLRELASSDEVAFGAISFMWTVDEDGSPLGEGELSQIRLAPMVEIEGDRAIVRDCVVIDPVPWPLLRNPGSTGGNVVFEAELERRPGGWLMLEFGPQHLVKQFGDGETCQP